MTTLAAGEMSHRWPFMLPDGNALLFSIWNDIGWEPARIVAQRTGSQEHKVIVPAGRYARFVADGPGTAGFPWVESTWRLYIWVNDTSRFYQNLEFGRFS